MSDKIGFIGLGLMGVPMAKNILKAGYDLTVYNRTAEKTDSLVELGAKAAASPKEIADQCECIILMLSDPEATEAVLGGEEGLQASEYFKGKTLINMSTCSSIYLNRLMISLRKFSVNFIDAPVSGSVKPAEDGNLVILAGGAEDKVDLAEPLLLTMGKKVVRCGKAGEGTKMKMVVNLLTGIMMQGLCESVVLGEKSGFSAETIMEAVLASPLSCGLFQAKEEMMKTGEFPPQFPLKHMAKDFAFIMQAANAAQTRLSLGNGAFNIYRHGMSLDMGDMDFAAVKEVLETLKPL